MFFWNLFIFVIFYFLINLEIALPDYDVFISYNWDIKDKVKDLHNKLLVENSALVIWRDEYEIKNNDKDLSEQLASAIKRSKIIICFITEKYINSKNCKCEFNYSIQLGKRIIVLLLIF